ncbi:FO synthase subunit 1, partial [Durusdinium trenchii]
EVLKALALNMMFRGCVSDPNEPGCEKFVVATINDDKWLRDPRAHISSLEIGAERDLLNPNSVFAVKGWNRSLAALLCLRAACELGDDLIKALLHTMGFRQLHMFCKIHGLGMDRFMLRHADQELLQLLTTTAPPADLNKVSMYASHMAKYTEEAGLDLQYLTARYNRGKLAVGDLIQKRHSIVTHRTVSLAHGDVVEKQASLGDVREVALSFNASTHQGDRRKTSQNCLFATMTGHRVSEMKKSRASLGAITAIDRTRVNELQNPEEDRPLAAHFRVQQRGIQATRQVLTNLLDGVPMKERHPVLVVDCMPNRFAEWSTACLDMLLEELGSDSHTGPCVHYMGVFLEESASMARNLEASVAGKLMANWIPDLVKNKYASSHPTGLKKIQDMINSEKDLSSALETQAAESGVVVPAASTSSGPAVVTPTPSRTLASPDYDGSSPPNFDRTVEFTEKALADFNSSQVLHCCALLAVPHSGLKIAMVKNDQSLWILNETSQNVELSSRELFGFNIGSGAGEKKLMTLAEAVCGITKSRGATEAAMVDHDLTPMTKVVGRETQPLAFRYNISGRAKSNAFRPKKIEEDLLNVRYSQFGGCFESYNTLPKSSNVGIVWEAGSHITSALIVFVQEAKRVTWKIDERYQRYP